MEVVFLTINKTREIFQGIVFDSKNKENNEKLRNRLLQDLSKMDKPDFFEKYHEPQATESTKAYGQYTYLNKNYHFYMALIDGKDQLFVYKIS